MCLRRGCGAPRTFGLFCSEHQPHHAVTDDMVAQASYTTATELLGRALDRGLIPPTTSYVTVAATS